MRVLDSRLNDKYGITHPWFTNVVEHGSRKVFSLRTLEMVTVEIQASQIVVSITLEISL